MCRESQAVRKLGFRSEQQRRGHRVTQARCEISSADHSALVPRPYKEKGSLPYSLPVWAASPNHSAFPWESNALLVLSLSCSVRRLGMTRELPNPTQGSCTALPREPSPGTPGPLISLHGVQLPESPSRVCRNDAKESPIPLQ